MRLTYSEPRTGFTRWWVGSKGVGSAEIRQRLISNMYTRTGSLLTASASELIVAVTAVLRHREPLFLLWIGSSLVLLTLRLGVLIYGKRRAARGQSTPTDLIMLGSFVWSVMVGLACLLCDVSGDTVLQVLSNVCVTSILGGLVARNASTPRLALSQLLATLGLLCLGAFLAPQTWMRVLLLQAPLYGLGIGSVCLRLNRELVAMLNAQTENASLARHDSLTGLPNRMLANETLAALTVEPDARFAVIAIDLDGFKTVNDTLGHAAGDHVLVETGRRLREACAGADLLARLGGDEFLTILSDPQPGAVEALARAIGAAIKPPYVLPNAPSVRVDASLGAAFFPGDGDDGDAVLIAADKALYAVKSSGKADFALYDAERHAGEGDRMLLRSDLEAALGEGVDQLELHYQPVARLSDGRIAGREALVRWRHPERGLIGPAEFVPVAETSGLVIRLGEWVLRRACLDAAGWDAPVKVAVNVSPVQLRNEHLAAAVTRALAGAALPPHRLEIEVTETALLGEDTVTRRNIDRLRALGVDVVLDDFGTGFSSLANLCRYPFDRIKIDGSFVREALHHPQSAAVIRATVQLARELGVPTTAECIETEEQLAFVRACGCSDVQGYLLGRPEPAADIPSRGAGARLQDLSSVA